MQVNQQYNWLETLSALKHPRVVTMAFLGFSAGIPILLIFSSLGLWLREAGIERATVTYFSWAALGYSFKFVWAPLVDQLPLPWLTRVMGRRRAWMLVAQVMILVAIVCMSSVDPQAGQSQLTLMALSAVLLGFSSATQDIVIDAYRIESTDADLQALMSATYIAGYRIAMLVAGAGSLYLATWFGSTAETYLYQAWKMTYGIMALTMVVGIVTTIVICEPVVTKVKRHQYSNQQYFRFLLLFLMAVAVFVSCFYFSASTVENSKFALGDWFSNRHLAELLIETIRLLVAVSMSWLIAMTLVRIGLVDHGMLEQTYIMPVRDFFGRYGLSLAWLLLALIGLYRISDIVLGIISNVFYHDLGYSKVEIANAVKVVGVLMTIVGGFAGGLLAMRFGVVRILFLGGVLSAATNLLFMLLASVGYDLAWLYFVVSADNLAAGLAGAAFVAFLSSLTNISFTAMQYAMFSSLMTLIPKVIGGYSGSIVDSIGYSNFFLVSALLGVPVLILILASVRRFEQL
jgi:PAT family beta-lactamase induction signal transducer AmpG